MPPHLVAQWEKPRVLHDYLHEHLVDRLVNSDRIEPREAGRVLGEVVAAVVLALLDQAWPAWFQRHGLPLTTTGRDIEWPMDFGSQERIAHREYSYRRSMVQVTLGLLGKTPEDW